MLQTDAERGLDSAQQIINRIVSSAVATDPDTGAKLYGMRGQPKAGALPRWSLVVPIPAVEQVPEPGGYVRENKTHVFRAASEAAAVEHARAYLAKRQART